MEIKQQALETENESLQKENEKMEQELQEYKQLTNSLKTSLSETASERNKEILTLKEEVLSLEENLRKQKTDFDFLTVEKAEVIQQLSSLKQLNYQSRIEMVEEALSASEEARKVLQDQLQKSETRLKLFFEQQKENSITAKVRNKNNFMNKV